jgi:hypothetical protein
MLRLLLKLALAAGAIAAVWSWVPISGRTLAARYRAAGSAPAFVDRSWSELTASRSGDPAKARTQARAPARERPTEGHTEADRRAVERLLTEQLRDSR